MDLHIEQRRGGLVETVHPVSVRVVERGEVGFGVGPDVASFWRSASKPMQLTTSLLHLPADVVDALSPGDLSIGAASHSGQAFHVERVRALLGRFGLDEKALRCGAHPPMHEESARTLWREGGTPGNVHNNCSGKHTFMLAASLREGWAADYRPADHPLQQENLARLTRWMGYAPSSAVDGCGVPTFHAPLSAMARAWAGLAAAMAGEDAVGGGAREAGLAARIGWAMHAEPALMSGEGRLDLAVVRASRVPLTVKVGAEGLFCIAVPSQARGIAVKVHTGNGDALAVAVRAVLDRLLPGTIEVPAGGEWPGERVVNVVGAPVGERVAVWGPVR